VSNIVLEGFVALACVPVPPPNGGHVFPAAVVVGVGFGAVAVVVFEAVDLPPHPVNTRRPARSTKRFMPGI
jgi:hypothetical protein